MKTGPSRQQFLLDSYLSEKGHEVQVYTLSESAEQHIGKNIIIRGYRDDIKFGMLGFSKKMFRDLCRHDYDLIHAHGYRNTMTETAAAVSFLTHRPLVLTSHGSVSTFHTSGQSLSKKTSKLLYDLITLRFTLRVVTRIVATTTLEQHEIRSMGVPSSKVVVIPHGVKVAPFPAVPPRGLPRTYGNRLLCVSRVSKVRNFEFLLRSFRLVLDEMPDAELIVAGSLKSHDISMSDSSYPAEIALLCKELGVAERVHFRGELDERALEIEYAKAAVFVWTSNYDNFGYPLLEAAARRIPIVSTPVGIAPNLVGENLGGYLVARDDIEGMAEAIVFLLRNWDAYSRASSYVLSQSMKFSLQTMGSAYEALYQTVASAREARK